MAIISAVQGIRDEISVRLNEAEVDNTDIYTNWINLSLRDIANSFPNAPFLWASADRTLSSATRVYNNLPADFDKMYDITVPEVNTKLVFLTPEEFDTLQPSATGGGNPFMYTIRNTGISGAGGTGPTIEFYWVPNGTPTVHYNYQKVISAISAGTDIPPIPTKYLELLILYGEKIGLRRRGLYEQSQFIDGEYQKLKEMMIQDLQRQTTENIRIKNVREFQKYSQTYSDPIRNIFNGILP